MGGLHERVPRYETPVRDQVVRLQAHSARRIHDHLGGTYTT
jgi:hypothetical protein